MFKNIFKNPSLLSLRSDEQISSSQKTSQKTSQKSSLELLDSELMPPPISIQLSNTKSMPALEHITSIPTKSEIPAGKSTSPSPSETKTRTPIAKLTFMEKLAGSVPNLGDSLFPMANGPQRAAEPGKLRKVALQPGHSPMDWAKFMAANDTAQVARISRYTLEDLSKHNTKEDCWISFQGRVYNVTLYLPYHPGGKAQLMRGAGKDATQMMMKIHPWVNIAVILDKCFVGYLVKEK